jgi:hypothetical protein
MPYHDHLHGRGDELLRLQVHTKSSHLRGRWSVLPLPQGGRAAERCAKRSCAFSSMIARLQTLLCMSWCVRANQMNPNHAFATPRSPSGRAALLLLLERIVNALQSTPLGTGLAARLPNQLHSINSGSCSCGAIAICRRTE